VTIHTGLVATTVSRMVTGFGCSRYRWRSGLQVFTGHKEPECTRTHHDHADVPGSEIVLRNACILALIITILFTGTHSNNRMYFR
jgi:hypothetical protein